MPAAIRPAPLPPRPVTPPAPVPPAIVGPPPPPVPRPADSAKTTEPEEDWIEEDFEEGEDLAAVPEPQPSERKAGLAGRLLSKLRLPGLKRRPADAEAELEPAPDDEDIYDEVEDDVVDDEDERFDTDEQAEPVPAPGVVDRNLRRLHGVAAQLVDGDLLAEAEKRTGNRIELRTVPAGLDLVVKGLPTALGTVRLSADDGHVVYQPRFGLDLPAREPNRADLELWTKAMGDLVVRVLEDIAERRKSRSETTPAVDEPT